MLVSKKRPRVLGWYHAGPLLFGDWGTSRLYVLGLAFFYTGHASVLYLGLLVVLMTAVAWAYTIICRCFPEGGGVYAAARQIHPMLAVLGATLLLADYIVTATISTVEAFHYFGLPEGSGAVFLLAFFVSVIAMIGVVNWLGAEAAGRAALIVAVLALGFSAVVAVLCLPFVPAGLRTISWGTDIPPVERWTSFVHIVLALSGVEAVANMTGLMKQPVARTARRTIWPVLAEVALLNLLFGVALAGLPALISVATPDAITHAGGAVPEEVRAYRDTAMKVLAIESGQYWLGENLGYILGKAAAIVFGLLLLSAANTAVVAMTSVMYSLGQDRELPRRLTRLNYSGVPAVPLLIACLLPVLLVLVVKDVAQLAALYAIGVVGAIALNVLCCAGNRALDISRWERRGLAALGAVMSVIWLTIAIDKWHATVFAGGLIAAVLSMRFFVRRGQAGEALPEPELGWLSEVRRDPLRLDPSRPRIMLAARGRYQAEFAIDMARRRHATLFVIYVRTLRVLDTSARSVPRVEDDPDAQESLGSVAVLARQYGVPVVPIYACSTNIAEEILDYTVTYGCDTLIMGKSRRRVFARRLEGDVLGTVAQHLPDGVALITRDADPHPLTPPTAAELAAARAEAIAASTPQAAATPPAADPATPATPGTSASATSAAPGGPPAPASGPDKPL